MENVTPIRPIDSKTIRQYDHKDGGYILVSEAEFSLMSAEGRSDYTLVERLPNAVEIAEWQAYQKFHSLWQKMIDKLEEMSAGRPKQITKRGHPIKWRYSTHDIANVLTWSATASNERIKALEEEIKKLKGE